MIGAFFRLRLILAILVSDSGNMRNIIFNAIRVRDCKKTLIRCWTKDERFGSISGLTFMNITATGPGTPASELVGFNSAHLIKYVVIQGIRINGRKANTLSEAQLKTNSYVKYVYGLRR